jgi:hypothetical protein
MAGLGWSTSVVTQEHLQNLVSLGYMIAAELATCRVPKDLTSHVPVGGYVMECTVFYEQGFGVPSHRFLYSLLLFYGLELHHLTPSEIFHMAAFVTLGEAYMGIDPTLTCGTIFAAPSYIRARTQKRQCWAVWTSMYNLGPKSIPIFLTLRSCGREQCSY